MIHAAGAIHLLPAKEMDPEALERLKAALTDAGFRLDASAQTVLAAIHAKGQSDDRPYDLIDAVRGGKQVLSVARERPPDKASEGLDWALEITVELALWMSAFPPIPGSAIQVTVPGGGRPRGVELTSDTADGAGPGGSYVSGRASRGAGFTRLIERRPRPESQALGDGHVSFAPAVWRDNEWQFDPALHAWAEHALHELGPRWTGARIACGCCTGMATANPT